MAVQITLVGNGYVLHGYDPAERHLVLWHGDTLVFNNWDDCQRAAQALLDGLTAKEVALAFPKDVGASQERARSVADSEQSPRLASGQNTEGRRV